MTNKELKQAYINAAVSEQFGNDPEGWKKYFNGKVGQVVSILGGKLVAIEKQQIDKNFCFGYSDSRTGSDYDRAKNEEAEAKESREYFISENLRNINALIESYKDTGEKLYAMPRYGTDTGTTTYTVGFAGWYGKAPENSVVVSDADRRELVRAAEQEKEDFTKRLNTYLKRYGLSKVHTWTYWRDA